MRKRLSTGPVFIILLVLAVVTVLALMTLKVYDANIIEKESLNGPIQSWMATEKATLVDWMVGAGIALNEKQVAQLHDNRLTVEQQDALATEIINSYYPAREQMLTAVDIIANEYGAYEQCVNCK